MPPETAARVFELVATALERTAEERSAFLDRACAGEADLRAEVDSLLSHEERVGNFIETPPVDLAAEAMALAGDRPREGKRIGAYRLLRRIGRGGMGSVYLAERDDEQYRKQVAIKVITFGLDYEEVRRRFRHERQILATLDHPHIAKLLDGGTTEDGLPYVVMDFVDGLPIDQYCEQQELGVSKRLELFRKVCSAVHYAHQHLVIHRDIKPGNILVTADGIPKLLDFGIAKLLAPDPTFTLNRATTELRALTPEYASPEQIKGERVTTATDIYSLGIVLYRLLTGGSAYRVKTQRPDEMARIICEIDPIKPSAVAIGNQKLLRGDLDNVVLMALRKEPTRRYASVAQFSADIRRHLLGMPVIAHPNTMGYRTVKFVRRHRLGVAAALLLFLSLFGGIIATGRQARTARRESAKAEAISSFLQRMLSASNPALNARARETKVKDVLDEASRRLALAELSGQPQIRAELQRIIGASYLAIGEYALAKQNLFAALATQTRLQGEDSPDALKTAISLAQLWAAVQGDYVKADQFYRNKLPLLRAEQKKGTISADYLDAALNGAALLRRAQGDSKQAELLLREELTLAPQLAADSVNVVEAVLALTLTDQGKFEPAIRMMRAKVASLRQNPAGETLSLAGSLTGLGSFLTESGELAEAEQTLHEAERIYRKVFQSSNMQLGDNLRLQAHALYLERLFAEADARISATLEIYRAAAGPGYVNYPTALMVQGLIWDQLGRTAEAEKLLREAVRLRSESVPESHFLRATANGALGEFLSAHQRFAEAEPLLLASYESLKKSQAPESPRLKFALQRLVALYGAWGRPEEAARY